MKSKYPATAQQVRRMSDEDIEDMLGELDWMHKFMMFVIYSVAAFLAIAFVWSALNDIHSFFFDNPNEQTVQTPVAVDRLKKVSNSQPLVPLTESVTTEELWALTNEYRQENGLQSLTLDPNLNRTSAIKCEDMVERDYFAHSTPDGQEPWAIYQREGYEYAEAGENLASGYNTSQEVLDGWATSESHNANLLRPSFTNVGYATCLSTDFDNQGAQLIVVQHFAR